MGRSLHVTVPLVAVARAARFRAFWRARLRDLAAAWAGVFPGGSGAVGGGSRRRSCSRASACRPVAEASRLSCAIRNFGQESQASEECDAPVKYCVCQMTAGTTPDKRVCMLVVGGRHRGRTRERERVSTRSARGGRRPRQQREGNNGHSSRPGRVIVPV